MNHTTVAYLLLVGMLIVSCNSVHKSTVKTPYDLRIAYNVLDNQDTLNYEIYWMDIDGSNRTNLTESTSVDWCVHAYGDKIYFLSDRDTSAGFYHLFEMVPATRSVRRMFNQCVVDSWVGSRKEGNEFVVCIEREQGMRAFIIIDSIGNIVSEVFETDKYKISDPFFSPDGDYIAFRSDKSGQDELWRMDVLGIEEKQLTSLANDSLAAGYYRAGPPCWVRDSNFITFTSRIRGNYEICKVNPDGKNQTVITTTPEFNEGWHTWSPDAEYIVFGGATLDATNYDIYLMKADGSDRIQLTKGPKYEHAPVFVKYYSKS